MSHDATIDRAIDRCIPRLIVPSDSGATIDCTVLVNCMVVSIDKLVRLLIVVLSKKCMSSCMFLSLYSDGTPVSSVCLDRRRYNISDCIQIMYACRSHHSVCHRRQNASIRYSRPDH